MGYLGIWKIFVCIHIYINTSAFTCAHKLDIGWDAFLYTYIHFLYGIFLLPLYMMVCVCVFVFLMNHTITKAFYLFSKSLIDITPSDICVWVLVSFHYLDSLLSLFIFILLLHIFLSFLHVIVILHPYFLSLILFWHWLMWFFSPTCF